MEKILLITHLVISVLLTLIIMVQNKDAGLSASMGGGESFQSTRRGPEKVIFRLTIFLAALFMLNAILFVFV